MGGNARGTNNVGLKQGVQSTNETLARRAASPLGVAGIKSGGFSNPRPMPTRAQAAGYQPTRNPNPYGGNYQSHPGQPPQNWMPNSQPQQGQGQGGSGSGVFDMLFPRLPEFNLETILGATNTGFDPFAGGNQSMSGPLYKNQQSYTPNRSMK